MKAQLVSNSTVSSLLPPVYVGSSRFIMLERFVPVSPSSAPECPGLPRISMVALWLYPGPARFILVPGQLDRALNRLLLCKLAPYFFA